MFALVAIVHLMRIIQGWPITIDTYAVPQLVSWVGFIITAFLAYYGLRFGTRDRLQ